MSQASTALANTVGTIGGSTSIAKSDTMRNGYSPQIRSVWNGSRPKGVMLSGTRFDT